MTIDFKKAVPIWPVGRECEMNVTVGFVARCHVPAGAHAVLRVTASSLYRAFSNGEFLGYGPARAAHGFYRVDEWTLQVSGSMVTTAIEVAGYNVNSFYTLDQPSFLQAEIVVDGRVVAWTGDRSFAAQVLDHRVQKTQRFSFMRPYSEVYRLAPGWDAWRCRTVPASKRAHLAQQPAKALLTRGLAAPDFSILAAARHLARGHFVDDSTVKLLEDRTLTLRPAHFKCYPPEELGSLPYYEIQRARTIKMETNGQVCGPADKVRLAAQAFHIFDWGVNRTGFLRVRIRALRRSRVHLFFDEILVEGDIRYRLSDSVNAVTLDLAPGRYGVEAFEPNTFRYVKVMVMSGEVELAVPELRQYVNSETQQARFACADPGLNRVFAAAAETFRQNAVDVFTDCPGRERGGYLCDGFFTARASALLTGNTDLERVFFENYALPTTFDVPDGMVPMCYPADSIGGFLPNWALWFIVQLEEYAQRSGDRQMAASLKARVAGILRWFSRYRNADGLLEKLDGWVFVEWSETSKYVQDVNYPTNMLYAGALAAAARLYGNRHWNRESDGIRTTIRKQAFDGRFFVDHAVRKDGKLHVMPERTETCQYYAFFFETATPDRYPGLWRTLCRHFGPRRDPGRSFSDIAPSNAFIGLMLRFELLTRYGESARMLEESRDYWLRMAEQTGTLWEHSAPSASCCHGFTSHVVQWLYRDLLGVKVIDRVKREVVLEIPSSPLAWCEGTIPVPGGTIQMRWERNGRNLRHECLVPPGYTLTQRGTGR